MTKKYEPSQMHKHLDEVVWEQLSREVPQDNFSIVHYQKWLFRKQDFPCGMQNCRSGDFVKFIVLPTGIYKTCGNCSFTERIDPVNDDGVEAVLLEDRKITDLENDPIIREVLTRYGQLNIYSGERPIQLPKTMYPRARVKRKPPVESETKTPE